MNIVHIGYPKTATTFLQWEVFPHLKGIHYVDYNACRKIFPPMIYRDIIDYEIREITDLMDQFTSGEPSNLFSFEALCGQPFGGVKGMNRSLIARRLKEIGFQKVIITLRNPVKAVDSYYRQYVIHGGTLNFQKFLDIDNKREWSVKHFNLAYLKYVNLIKIYEELFGSENVLIIGQENLKNDLKREVSRLESFTNSRFDFQKFDRSPKKDVNSSLSNLSTELLRMANFFTYNTIRPSSLITHHLNTRNFWLALKLIGDPYLFRFFSSRKDYVKKYNIEEKLHEYFQEANIALQKYDLYY